MKAVHLEHDNPKGNTGMVSSLSSGSLMLQVVLGAFSVEQSKKIIFGCCWPGWFLLAGALC